MTNAPHTTRRIAPLASLASSFVVLALLACVSLGGVVRAGRLPAFYAPVWFANQQAIIFFSGKVCPAGEWRAACDMGLGKRVFSVTYWTPSRSNIIVWLPEQ